MLPEHCVNVHCSPEYVQVAPFELVSAMSWMIVAPPQPLCESACPSNKLPRLGHGIGQQPVLLSHASPPPHARTAPVAAFTEHCRVVSEHVGSGQQPKPLPPPRLQACPPGHASRLLLPSTVHCCRPAVVQAGTAQQPLAALQAVPTGQASPPAPTEQSSCGVGHAGGSQQPSPSHVLHDGLPDASSVH